jgi:AraC-like DNA-binding protein
MAGFDNSNYFSRLFKKHEGILPISATVCKLISFDISKWL